MSWRAHLKLDYRHENGRTVVHDRHDGPLRILQSLYPEGPGVCHNVVVHPPAGIAGGDELLTELTLDAHSHALLTTPGATRFYRSQGPVARQTVQARVAPGARLEWVPLETLCYRQAIAENHLRFDLATDAEMIGWDLLGLGLPAQGSVFDEGSVKQTIEIPGVWLERGIIHGHDQRLRESPLGLAERSVLGVMWFAAGSPLKPELREALLTRARDCIDDSNQDLEAASTSPSDPLVVLRILAHRVEPAMQLMRSVWAQWRAEAWGVGTEKPRVWGT